MDAAVVALLLPHQAGVQVGDGTVGIVDELRCQALLELAILTRTRARDDCAGAVVASGLSGARNLARRLGLARGQLVLTLLELGRAAAGCGAAAQQRSCGDRCDAHDSDHALPPTAGTGFPAQLAGALLYQLVHVSPVEMWAGLNREHRWRRLRPPSRRTGTRGSCPR